MHEDGRVIDSPGWWRFGNARLDDANARLIVEGHAHELDHSSHGLLQCLLANAGNLVSKEQLLHAGWPGRVVSENSLAKAIGRLRHALEDADGRVLVTVHGYGYRLATRAEFVPASPAPPAPVSLQVEGMQESAQELRTGQTVPPRWSPGVAGIALVLLFAPVATWWFVAHAPGPVARSPVVAPTSVSPSIAVLPFADMSQAGDQQYFSDGLADELLDKLSKLPQLRVAGRTSSFSFRGKSDDVSSIGRKLNVAHVLEGSVRKSGDRVRITVQLINVKSGFHIWSHTYDRMMTDIFQVQDDIATSVASALQLKLLPGQSEAVVAQRRTSSPEAYTFYLLAKQFRTLGTSDSDRRAIAALNKAIALDPKFASAYAALADLLGGEAEYADTPEQVATGKRNSLALMDKAIELDDSRAEFYLARADFLYHTKWDWAGAQRDLDRTAVLQPGEDTGRMMRQSRLYAALGRVPEAIALDRRATQLEPMAAWAWGMLGYHSAVVGRLTEARAALVSAHRLSPTDNHVLFYMGLTALLEGKPAEAQAQFERGGGPFRLCGMAMAQHDAGRREQSNASLDALIAKFANTGAYQIAQVYAWQGDRDSAFAWLDRANAQRDAGLIYLKFDPLMAKLRDDPRYTRWLERMRLPPG